MQNPKALPEVQQAGIDPKMTEGDEEELKVCYHRFSRAPRCVTLSLCKIIQTVGWIADLCEDAADQKEVLGYQPPSC